MLPRLTSFLSALAACSAVAFSASVDLHERVDYSSVCAEIAGKVSNNTKVLYPGSSQYDVDMAHWNPSSSQPSACSVEPATAEDVSNVLKIVGPAHVPFTIKSGGHATNPNFSSTPGVLIVMTQFTGTVYNAAAQTASIGVGQIWEDVYSALLPFNVSVTGGRAPGIGVGGFIAGGGYAWQTSEIGLAVDNVVGYELVQPSGKIIKVTESTEPELFWALKGTGNNFGVITRVTMKTFKQGLVWGGQVTLAAEHADAMIEAFANYDANVKDEKAAINVVFSRTVGTPGVISYVQVFYNGPEPPAGIFEDVLAIPATVSDIKTRTVGNLVSTLQFPVLVRSSYDHVPINQFPLELVKSFVQETADVAADLAHTTLTATIVIIEAFQRSLLTHATPVKGFRTPSAWPPTRDFATYPNGFWALYNDPADDAVIKDAVLATSDRLREKGASLGLTQTAMNATDVGKYPNYAQWGNTPQQIYGSALPTLQKLQNKYDPKGVMKLAGGFKLY